MNSTVPTSSGEKPARDALKADAFAASVVLMLATTVLQRAVGFGRGILFCRWMTPDELGLWEMAYSFLLTAAPLVVLGVPGSFGRYAEHYRQRGHLRTFLRRTAVWTAVTGGAATLLGFAFAPQLAQWVFGEQEFALLAAGSVACLASVILTHTITSLLAGLRQYRAVSSINFLQSMAFAAVSLALLLVKPTVASIVIGYTASCVVASAAGLVWFWPVLRSLDRPTGALPHAPFWNKLLRFAFFIWATNCLSNLFAVVDRAMLIHCSGLSPTEALVQVGHYHSSRVIPVLLVSVADLLSGLVMPHLSHDWEIGRRDLVSRRLNLTLKLTTLGMMTVGVGVLAAGPLVFHVVLHGKYDGGLAVLPWTLAGCLWFGVTAIAQNYLFCAEKARQSVAPLAVGLATNVILNFILLPLMGLQGAVLATAIATALSLAITLALNQTHGMSVDRGTWILAAAPVACGFGTILAAATASALIAAAMGSNMIFDRSEREELLGTAWQTCRSFAGRLGLPVKSLAR
jgi:O-antigen/teichoic acid export membrane protein